MLELLAQKKMCASFYLVETLASIYYTIIALLSLLLFLVYDFLSSCAMCLSMKILFAVKTLSHAVGGGEKLACFVASAFSKDPEYDVWLLSFDATQDKAFYPVADAVNRCFLAHGSPGQRTTAIGFLKSLFALRKSVLAIRPDIVVAFMHSMFIPMQMALYGTGIKVVLSEHTVPVYYKTRPVQFMLLQISCIMTNNITIATNEVKELYPKNMRKKMTVLTNPIGSDYQRDDAMMDHKMILSVGRLNKDKDHEILIRAFALLHGHTSAKDWRVVIYGDGEEKEHLERLIKEHGLNGHVLLAGVTKDMDSVYKAAGLYVHPSRYESFGLVTAEAMSHGLPVIGFSDCPGTMEIIDDGITGILVKTRTAHDMATQILYLLEHEDVRAQFGEAAYKKSMQWHPERVIAQWKDYACRCLE
jgi:glycosyltransferase involved in cell wall biosynthesis